MYADKFIHFVNRYNNSSSLSLSLSIPPRGPCESSNVSSHAHSPIDPGNNFPISAIITRPRGKQVICPRRGRRRRGNPSEEALWYLRNSWHLRRDRWRPYVVVPPLLPACLLLHHHPIFEFSLPDAKETIIKNVKTKERRLPPTATDR